MNQKQYDSDDAAIKEICGSPIDEDVMTEQEKKEWEEYCEECEAWRWEELHKEQMSNITCGLSNAVVFPDSSYSNRIKTISFRCESEDED